MPVTVTGQPNATDLSDEEDGPPQAGPGVPKDWPFPMCCDVFTYCAFDLPLCCYASCCPLCLYAEVSVLRVQHRSKSRPAEEQVDRLMTSHDVFHILLDDEQGQSRQTKWRRPKTLLLVHRRRTSLLALPLLGIVSGRLHFGANSVHSEFRVLLHRLTIL